MTIWRFSIQGDEVEIGDGKRRKLTEKGCNEPFKDRYWCPKLQWFRKEACPFINKRECENYKLMCGCI